MGSTWLALAEIPANWFQPFGHRAMHLTLGDARGSSLDLPQGTQGEPCFISTAMNMSPYVGTHHLPCQDEVYLACSGQNMGWLILTVWAQTDAVEVGWYQRKLIRPIPFIQHVFWNTSGVIAVTYNPAKYQLKCQDGVHLAGSGWNTSQLVPTIWA